MIVKSNFSLKDFNSFGIDVKAKQFIEIHNFEELRHVLKKFYTEEIFVLGGGSNMLLTKDIDKTVLYINNKGIHITKETKNEVVVEVKAGENWHDFVLWSVGKAYGGIENLALIPGHVGTSPIQNIGAYGVELKDTLISCKAIHRQTLDEKIFSNEDCKFGYRQSIFKSELKNQYIIISVKFKLTKKKHKTNIDYGAIKEELTKLNITAPEPKDISKVVINIRQSKLPDPKDLGNSGSFFKNPIINREDLEKLKLNYPEIPFYNINESKVKIPAGWLIEKSGLKGFRNGDAGVHKKQALVLVNYGCATGQEILQLSEKIQNIVFKKFGIELEAEVNII